MRGRDRDNQQKGSTGVNKLEGQEVAEGKHGKNEAAGHSNVWVGKGGILEKEKMKLDLGLQRPQGRESGWSSFLSIVWILRNCWLR